MLRAMANNGRLVWYELLTSDVNGAIAFYTEVIGWKTQAWETGNYTMWAGAQGPLGGVTQLPDQAKQMGAPPYWQANVQVANLDTAVAKVKELGGKILVEEDVPTIGRFAVIADPQGAVIALYTPTTEMAPHDTSKPGEFQWHELYTTDHAAAFEFYRQVCGWEKIQEHKGCMTVSGEFAARRGAQAVAWMHDLLQERLLTALETDRAVARRRTELEGEVRAGRRTPVLAVDELVDLMHARQAAVEGATG